MAQVMAAFWSSPEQLSVVLRWLTLGWLAIAAVFGYGIYRVTDRIGTPAS